MDTNRTKTGLILTFFVIANAAAGLWLPHLTTENSEHVQLHVTEHEADIRERRSTSSLPTGLDITLYLDGRDVILSLRRIVTSDTTLPVHVLRNGTIVEEILNIEKESGFYEDASKESLLLLQRQGSRGSKNLFTLFGTFLSGSDRYIIQQSNNITTEDDDIPHVVTKMPGKALGYTDDVIIPEKLFYKKRTRSAVTRSKRQVKQYYIELYMVTDFSVYTFWKNKATGTSSQRDLEAKQSIRTFFSYVLYGIDQRYRSITDQTYTLRVVSPGLLILDRSEDASMTELNKVTSSPRDILGSNTALDAFTKWENSQTGLPQRDHTMLFTNYDIVTGSGTGNDGAGIAYVEGLCSNKAHSVVEDQVNPFTMTTAAHELGHSLGASHDGSGNTCSGENNYIMAAVNSVAAAPELIQNMFKFSSCSKADFTAFINKLNRNNNNCMTQTNPSSAPPSIDKPMAEVYSPDEICVLTEGEGSFVCRSIQNYSTLCAIMYCKAPGTSHCYTVLPPEGTSCGRGKVCEAGKCVSSPNAPLVPDNCPLGDQPGIISPYAATCSAIITTSPSRCYGSSFVKNCCESCASIYTGIKGCEYGDQASNCDASLCQFYDAENRQLCCESCGTSVRKTTTTTTKKVTTTPTTTTTKSTKSVFSTTAPTDKPNTVFPTRSTVSSSSGTHAMPTEQEESSDAVAIGVGVGISLVIMIIIAVIILFILYKQGNKYIRKQSKSSNNAYDNIGFVKPSSEVAIPHHPPPRRENSKQSPVRPLPLPKHHDGEVVRPPNLNLDHSGDAVDPQPNEIDGYMTPNGVSVKTISNGVHYTAPDKPTFNLELLKHKLQSNHPRNLSVGSNGDSPNSQRKPKHYRRSGAVNANRIGSSNMEGHVNESKEEPQSSRNNENLNRNENRGLTQNNNQAYESLDNGVVETETYNEISEVINRFNQGAQNNDQTRDTDTNTSKVSRPNPLLPPKPRPRSSVNSDNKPELNLSCPKVPLRPRSHKNTDENVSSDHHPEVALKPTAKSNDIKSKLNDLISAENRTGVNACHTKDSTSIENNLRKTSNDQVKKKPTRPKPPTRPPMRPVPRRQLAQDNPSFEKDNSVAI